MTITFPHAKNLNKFIEGSNPFKSDSLESTLDKCIHKNLNVPILFIDTECDIHLSIGVRSFTKDSADL